MQLDALDEFAFEDSDPPPRVYGLNGAVVIELHGDIDLLAYQRVNPLIDPITAGPAKTVIIDLREITFFDCSGISLLVRAHRHTTARGGHLSVVCTHALTLRILSIAGLTAMLSPAPTLQAALDAAG
ncbi:STAS domain-containing protein [Streptomyces sp. NBC_01381]|uniref:STAS domain-containing protein n=1 Tax=Streptomyces sp. NBC_01381 TaxID=2903845 RepID=UPI00225309FD|nr:STAS domain-containing protein [Streptomyces sp. NBC_01381]MCX4669051.1 STAS domain-containing protein [Streptomyces sp. NBC_01381]